MQWVPDPLAGTLPRLVDSMTVVRLRERRSRLLLGCGAAAALAACHAMGPGTIARDRFDYVSSVSDSWKRQTLLNLIKVRYSDAPTFLDVSSLINSYSWEADVNLSGQLAPTGRGDTFVNLGGAGRYADRPTITYAPLRGPEFARALLSSLPVTAILHLIESGYPAEAVLRFCVNSINGLENDYGGPGNPRHGSMEFFELLSLFRSNRTETGLDLLLKHKNDDGALVLVLRHPADEEARVLDGRFRRLLRLDPQLTEFDVVHGPFAASPREVAIQTRSMMQVLIDLASHIEVPAADLAEGRVYAPQHSAAQLRMFPPMLDVHSGLSAPPDAYAAVRYRDHWYWIEDRDVKSKLAFNFLMLTFSLTETATSQQAAPIVTVPAR